MFARLGGIAIAALILAMPPGQAKAADWQYMGTAEVKYYCVASIDACKARTKSVGWSKPWTSVRLVVKHSRNIPVTFQGASPSRCTRNLPVVLASNRTYDFNGQCGVYPQNTGSVTIEFGKALGIFKNVHGQVEVWIK